MKRSLLLLLTITLFFGCSDTVEFNNPALQGNFEGQAWRADFFSAATQDGGLVVRGQRGSEVLLIFTTRTDVGQYPLGDNNVSEIRFRAADGTVYSTLNAPDPSFTLYPSDGLVEIEEFNTVTNTVTGTYRFNAFTADGLGAVNFIQGVFFQVPLLNNITEVTNGTTCDLATAATATIQTEIAGGMMTPEKCAELQAALALQLLACDDTAGTLQATLDNIDCDDDDMDGIPNSFEDLDMDGDLTNDDTDMDGLPNYLDADDDGDGVPTNAETGDTDGDTIPNYLDNDDDGDSILSIFEDAAGGQNSDGDGIPDYLDNDDDGDGALTIDEGPDPNGDGNPNDALDSDMDGTPDYLQA